LASKKDKYLESAQRFMLKGQLDKAIKDYQQVVALEPKEIRYRQKLAELLVRDNRKEEAIAQYEDIGKHYADNSYFLKAIAVYKQIQRLSPDNKDIALTLASLNHKQGLIGNALSEYGQVVALLEKEGAIKEAIKVVEQMLTIDAEQPATRLKHAELLFKAHSVEESFQAFVSLMKSLRKSDDAAAVEQVSDRLRKLFPGRPLHDFDAIASQIAAGDLDAAIASVQQVLKSDGANLQAWQLLCDAQRRKGDKAALREVYRGMMERFPEDPLVLEGGIHSEIHAGNCSGAFELLERHLPLFVEKGAAKSAEALFQALPREMGEGAKGMALIRRLYEASGDWDKLSMLDQQSSGSGKASIGSAQAAPTGSFGAELPLQLDTTSTFGAPWESPASAPAATAGGELPLPWEEEIELDLDDDVLAAASELPAVNDIELPLDFTLSGDFPEQDTAAPAAVGGTASADPFADASPFSEIAPFEEPSEADAPSLPVAVGAPLPAEEVSLPLDLELESPLELTLPQDSAFPDFDWNEEAEDIAEVSDVAGISEIAEVAEVAEAAEASEVTEVTEVLEVPEVPEVLEVPEAAEAAEAAEAGAPYEAEAALQPRGWDEIYPAAGSGDSGSLDLAELESHYDLGIGYKEMGMYREAIKAFDVAASNPQRRLDCLTLQAICYRDKGEAEKSEQLLKQGLDLEVLSMEERISLSYELAYLFETTGDANAAIPLYREVHHLNPSFHDVAERLANLSGEEPLDIIDLDLEDADL
jgi:pilus assembly protein FimV